MTFLKNFWSLFVKLLNEDNDETIVEKSHSIQWDKKRNLYKETYSYFEKKAIAEANGEFGEDAPMPNNR